MSMRSNESWLRDLNDEGVSQQEALSDLRMYLLRGLNKVFGNRNNVDNAFIEDTLQDALLKILQRIDQFQGRSRFTTWATTIAIHVGMAELRRKRWKDVSLDQMIGDGNYGLLETSSQYHHTERNTLILKMHEVIEQELTDKQRAVLLAELKGIPPQEIARQMGSNRNAIYKLTHDARLRLRDGLVSAGYQQEDIKSIFSG